MINAAKRNEILGMFDDAVKATVEECCADINLVDSMLKGNVEEVRNSIFKIQNCIIASVPEGVAVPKVSIYITPAGADVIDVITLSIGNKLNSTKKFKYQYIITRNSADTETVVDYIKEAYARLIVDELAESNLAKLNEVLGVIVEKANLSYAVKVVSSLGVDNKIVSELSNDNVVFVANDDRVFEMDDILIVAEPDGEFVTEDIIENAIVKEAEMFAECQTPEQLIDKHGCTVISYIANINKQVKAMTIIKKFCSKEYSKVRGNADAVAFFKDVNVYAIVSKVDGKFEVQLSPFDITTMRRVDYDVLAMLKAEGYAVQEGLVS